MAGRPVHVLLISLLLYELTSGDYCRNGYNSSIQFCQSGIISGSKLYINGSSVKTKEELKDRGCVCYLEQTGNRDIYVNAGGSCVYCGLQVTVGNAYFRPNYYDFLTYGWGSKVLNDTKFTMTLDLYENAAGPNTAFCITIQPYEQNSSVVLNLTCEDLVPRSSTAISTIPNVTSTPPTMAPNTTKGMSPTSTENAKSPKIETTMIPDTTKGMSPTSTETAIPPKIETTNPTVVIAGNTNGTHGLNANTTYRGTTTTTKTTTTTGNDPGEPRVHSQNEEIVVGAAIGGSCGGVVLVIVINVIIFICYKRRIKNKYMQRQSKAPARVYTELEFGSRDGQNDNHVYNSIEPQQIYNNNVQ